MMSKDNSWKNEPGESLEQLARMLDRLPPGTYEISLQKQDFARPGLERGDRQDRKDRECQFAAI